MLTQGLLFKYYRAEIFQSEASKAHLGSWCPPPPASGRHHGPASCGHGSLLLPWGAGSSKAGLNWGGRRARAPAAAPGSPGWGWGEGR